MEIAEVPKIIDCISRPRNGKNQVKNQVWQKQAKLEKAEDATGTPL